MAEMATILKQKLTVLETEYNKNLTELQTLQASHNKLAGKIEITLQLLKETTSTETSKDNNNLKLAE